MGYEHCDWLIPIISKYLRWTNLQLIFNNNGKLWSSFIFFNKSSLYNLVCRDQSYTKQDHPPLVITSVPDSGQFTFRDWGYWEPGRSRLLQERWSYRHYSGLSWITEDYSQSLSLHACKFPKFLDITDSRFRPKRFNNFQNWPWIVRVLSSSQSYLCV